MQKFNEGDTVYFVASSVFVRKAKVVRNAGGFCTIIFDGNGNCGTSGTRVRESKLYRTEEEANEVVKLHKEANKRRWWVFAFTLDWQIQYLHTFF